MSFSETVIQKAFEAVKRYSLISKGDKVLVGFSGGADSTVLLSVMHELIGDRVCAFHVNHMLRGADADADELFCRRFCESRGIPFNSVHIDIMALSGGSGVEETARNERYSALTAECERIGAKKIALAHTASDNIETVIFNLARGASLSGMRGIPPKRPQQNVEVIRPLILCTREEIEGYCREHELSFCTDKTNSDTNYTRNFIRHKIVPLMKEINPNAEARAISAGDSLSRDADFIALSVESFAKANVFENSCAVSALLDSHPAVRSRVISKMYGGVCSEKLEARHFEEIDLFIRNNKNGARIVLPCKIIALLRDNRLVFMTEDDYLKQTNKEKLFESVKEGFSEFGNFAVLLCKRGEEKNFLSSMEKEPSFTAKTLLPADTASELTVRTRESGEKYVFGGMTRTLKKLLSGESDRVKAERPVFCDKSGIIWFPPFRIRDDIYKKADLSAYTLYYFEY